MALIKSKYVSGPFRSPVPDSAGEVVAIRYEYAFTAAQLVTGNILDLGVLPADCRVTDMILDSDDLDSGSPAVTLDVGIMTGSPGETLDAAGNARTMGAEFFSATTIAQAGGVVRPSLTSAFRVASVAYDRSIGVKVLLQPATAADGTIGLTVLVRG